MPPTLEDRPVRRGAARGVRRNGIDAFHGLRYATLSDPANPCAATVPSSGQLKGAELTDVPVFPQLPSRLEGVMGPGIRDNPQSDDAFFFNVWAPADADRLPVLVFLHGGAWVSGGGSARWYRGDRLAAEGLVIVTLNYRIGPAGHLDDGVADDRHRPIEDCLAALRVVADRIGDFGGDPDRIALAGQSAGAWYAWALSSLPETRGLIRRTALFSIPEITPWTADSRRAFTARVHETCDRNAGGWAPGALLEAGAKVLADSPRIPGAIPPMYLPVWPTERAGADLPLHVEALHLRVTAQEMSVFLPPYAPGTRAASLLLETLRARTAGESLPEDPVPEGWSRDRAETVARASWLGFGRFADAIGRAAAARGVRVTQHRFTAFAGPGDLGAPHCFDLPFQFGNRNDWRDAPMLEGWSAEAFEAVSRGLRAELAGFVTRSP